jgi:O-antigen/teichoic acid export membrane protein
MTLMTRAQTVEEVAGTPAPLFSPKQVWSRLCANPLVANAGWMFGGQAASLAVQALYFVLLARLLGRTEYGILAGSTALVSIFSQFSGMGSGVLFLRYVCPDRSRFREYWGNILLSILLIGTVVTVLLVLAGRWSLGAASASLVAVLAIGDCFCIQLTMMTAQVFQAFEKMKITAGLNLLVNSLRLVLAIVLTVTVHQVTAFGWAIGSSSVSLVGCLIAILTATFTFGLPTFSFGLFLRRITEGFVFAISGSTTVIYNDVDKVMLGHYGMEAANGIYSMAYRLVSICTLPISSIHAAILPRFFIKGVDGIAGTYPIAKKLLKRTVILGALAAIGLASMAPVVPHLVGNGFSKSVSALRWLCLIPLFRSFHLSAGDAISGAGFQRLRLASQFVAAAGNFGLNLFLIPRYSWLGAAWASLLTDGSLALFNWSIVLFLKRQASTNVPRSAEYCAASSER